MSVKVGDTAPQFTLKNQDAENVSLSDFQGKNIVVLFFPFAFSSVCSIEMKKMQQDMEKFTSLNAQILGISVDSHYTLRAWKKDLQINFPLLSDFNKEVSRLYDSFYEIYAPGKYDYKGVSKRSAFVIDKKGKIIYKEICPNSGEQPDYDSIKKTLGNE